MLVLVARLVDPQVVAVHSLAVDIQPLVDLVDVVVARMVADGARSLMILSTIVLQIRRLSHCASVVFLGGDCGHKCLGDEADLK